MTNNPALQTPSQTNNTGLKDAVEASLVSNNIPTLLYKKSPDTPGVYINWNRNHYTGVAYYRIQRTQYPDSNVWETIASIQWPQNEYIDMYGNPNYFYRVEEIDKDFNSLGFTQSFPASEVLIKQSLMWEVEHLLYLPVYQEDATFNRDRTSAKFAYGGWAYNPSPTITISGYNIDGDRDATFILDGTKSIYQTIPDDTNYNQGLKIRLDYNGGVQFVNDNNEVISLDSTDIIKADYYVQVFSNAQMNNALELALQTINQLPGTSKYATISGTPFWYDPALICGAAYILYRQLKHSMLNKQWRMLFQNSVGGEGNGDNFNATEYLNSIAEEYNKVWEKHLANIPKATYPRILGVVTPEYQLPGGRSRFFRAAFGHPY